MISKEFGAAKIFITDAPFGHVGVGQQDFPERFAQQFGFFPEHIVWMDQVHSPTVEWLEDVADKKVILPETDGVLTQKKNVLLITKTADCVPVLLWNEQEKIVGALHCGWKGFMAGILEDFANQCRRRNLLFEHFSVFLGPHLRVESFEVQQDFMDQVPEEKKVFLEVRDGKNFYNLTKGVISVLSSFGIKNIEDCGIDTFSSPDYYSYRAWTKLPVDQRPENYNTFANCIILS